MVSGQPFLTETILPAFTRLKNIPRLDSRPSLLSARKICFLLTSYDIKFPLNKLLVNKEKQQLTT
jgi:hypothetical protein